ncbi:MAG: SprB repeat-containing protein [Bacteroidales bacterium]
MMRCKRILLLLLVIILANNNIFAQNVGDYRSRASGNWNANNVWQRWDGTNWQNVATWPTAADGVITIRGGHTITFNMNSIDVDQMVIDAGGRLQFASSPSLLDFNIVDGPGVDLINNGTINVTDYTSSDSRLKVFGQAVNNGNIIIEVDCHIHVYGTFTNNSTITTNYSAQYRGRFIVFLGATLKCAPTSVIGGGGDFVLGKCATIEIGSPAGISALGSSTGNITTSRQRDFSPDATYIYNGVANQITGTGLVGADGVIIDNPNNTVTFSRAVDMNYLLIDNDAFANLGSYTHTAGYLSLPIGSFSVNTWGSTASPAVHKNDEFFDVAATGIVQLTNKVVLAYTSSTTFTTCPTDTAFRAIIEAWGGGGKGGTRTNSGAGGGGGGGAYSRDTILITPGHIYTITVGRGATTTAAGEDSWFSPTANVSNAVVLAKGGNSVPDNTITGANGGSSILGIGAVRFSGGRGATGITGSGWWSQRRGGGGGSSAGVNADGNTPPTTGGGNPPTPSRGATAPLGGGDGGHAKFDNVGPGSPGDCPGGGGGGSYGANGETNAGGFGSHGLVRITCPPSHSILQLLDTPIVVCHGTSLAYLKYSILQGCPDLYKIEYNKEARNAGFQDVAYTTLTADSILIAVPDTAPGGIYKGILTVKSGERGFPSNFPFTIKILETTFTTLGNDVSCYGGNDGSISITITSGNDAPYSFSIDNGISYSASFSGTYPNYILTNLSANTYKIRIKNNKGCVTASCP